MRTTSPTIAWRGKLAQAVHQAHQHRDPEREVSGRIRCPACGSPINFTVQRDGRSRGQCSAAGCMRWST